MSVAMLKDHDENIKTGTFISCRSRLTIMLAGVDRGEKGSGLGEAG